MRYAKHDPGTGRILSVIETSLMEMYLPLAHPGYAFVEMPDGDDQTHYVSGGRAIIREEMAHTVVATQPVLDTETTLVSGLPQTATLDDRSGTAVLSDGDLKVTVGANDQVYAVVRNFPDKDLVIRWTPADGFA